MAAPGVAVALPSVFVIPRSACGVSVSVSVSLLFPGVGSVTPPGAVIVAVLTSDPVADADTVPVAVKVAVPPTGRLTSALMSPLPLAGQLAPPPDVHVHVTPLTFAGKRSLTVALVTALGPALVAMMV